MLSISSIAHAGAAASYYRQVDDYYKSEHAPTQWQGKGAELLGLRGEVEGEQFTSLLEGRLPDGTVLGRLNGDGQIQHRAGWDLTFSAPKSVSIAALVAGDERIIAAHERAVAKSLDHIESVAATARNKARELAGEAHATDNLIFATFRHVTSREQDPQLHTHCVLANATQDESGKWRSIESRPIFRMQKEAGELYRQELARELQSLGYQLDRKPGGKGEFLFELAGVPAELVEHFSGRSAQVEAALAARGKTRDTATAKEKETAALDTRRGKEATDHAELRANWRAEARSLGIQADSLRPEAPDAAAFAAQEAERARAAVKAAAEHLGEKQTRISRGDLEREARRFARGDASSQAIRSAIRKGEANGDLVQRRTRAFDVRTGRKQQADGYTTPEAVATERKMLARVDQLSRHAKPITAEARALESIERRERETGYSFSQEQRAATLGVLTGEQRLHVIQGLAGVGKTSSVLASVSEAARREGLSIKALAPTASAAQVLAAEIGAEASTLARHLNDQRAQGERQLWIVDESSLVSAGDMQRLLSLGERENARVILVGDVHQLGSVEAGAALEQIQQHVQVTGGQVHELTELVRPRSDELRAAVYHSVEGEARAALEKLEAGAGQVHEIVARPNDQGRTGREERAQARAERIAAIAEAYTRLTPEERTRTLVIDPSRDGRAELNQAIRERLQETGAVERSGVTVRTIEARDLSRVEMKLADSYQVGDVLKAHRDYSSLGLERGDTAQVVAVDLATNRLTIERDGKQQQINPTRYSSLTVHEQRAIEVAAGDTLVVRSNDVAEGVKNGQSLVVVGVEEGKILGRTEHGVAVELDATKPLSVDYGYTITAHQSQGRTADRVLIHSESTRQNLQTQQQLYVSISRARQEVNVFTDNRSQLIQQLERESGRKEQAIATQRELDQPAPSAPGKSQEMKL